jgi:hypothetical protein
MFWIITSVQNYQWTYRISLKRAGFKYLYVDYTKDFNVTKCQYDHVIIRRDCVFN